METLNNNLQQQIGQLVANDFRTAAVFSKYGIDFCCKGNKTLEEVCTKKHIDSDTLMHELEAVLNSPSSTIIDFNSWPLDLLADYIQQKHHSYVEEKLPVILQFLNKLCQVHGERHPELLKIYYLFLGASKALASHMKKEELILFPFIKAMIKAKSEGYQVQLPSFQTVENPIDMMKNEHDNEGERFKQIAQLSSNYSVPEDGCTTYKVAYAMLEEFEQDLHMHIHLENNILFPKAIQMEQDFNA